MDHNNNNNLASASFDIMNEPLMPTQTIDTTVMPSIQAISNNILNTSTVTTMNEFDNLNDYKHKHNNISNTNTNFELKIDDLFYFVDSGEKNVAPAQPTLVTPARIEDKKMHLFDT